jgi:hypothetical protein
LRTVTGLAPTGAHRYAVSSSRISARPSGFWEPLAFDRGDLETFSGEWIESSS